MKNSIYTPLLLFFLVGFCIVSCNKADDTPNAPLSTGYMQFKMDGTTYRIEDYNLSSGTGTVMITNTPSIPLYQLVVVFLSSSPGGADNFSLQQLSPNPLEKKNYVYDSFNATERPVFIQVLPNQFTYVLSSSSTGNIHLTRLDTISGGKVEGTFNFNNLDYKDKSGQLISSGHTLTEGSFSIVVD